jgi:RHS repeat-associated protein
VCVRPLATRPRITKQNCGSVWSQTFGADMFGNLTKSGTISFQPSYVDSHGNTSNRVVSVGSVTPGYDANGNLQSDGVNTYAWDADGKMRTANCSTVTYDALDRAVEVSATGHTQVVYDPLGNKLALMNGQTLVRAFVGLTGGATAVYNASGLQYYRHSDWLNSSRLASTPSRTTYYDGAYAAYGENYAETTGTQDRNFTGKNQDIASTGSYPLYDFLMREYHPTWGRWVSPDPAGLAAADPTNPQSWNRYAYVLNSPTNLVDPLGLIMRCPFGQTNNVCNPPPSPPVGPLPIGPDPPTPPPGPPPGTPHGPMGPTGPGQQPSTPSEAGQQKDLPPCIDVFISAFASPFVTAAGYIQSAPSYLQGAAASLQAAGFSLNQISAMIDEMAAQGAADPVEAADMVAKLGITALGVQALSGTAAMAAEGLLAVLPEATLGAADASLLYGVIKASQAKRNGQCR